jgi:molybdopterin-dependent oxidoreductase alpha subunit
VTRRIRRGWKDKLAAAVPFGLGQTKPHHFAQFPAIIWENRDNLPYAWNVLTKGVCDGCALGVAGLHDWTMEGVHLCMTRLELLRLNTMPALDSAIMSDVERLRSMSNRELRQLGRLPYPYVRRRGEGGFTRLAWDDALGRIARRIRASDPKRIAFYLTSRGLTNETYYVAQKVARYLGTNNIDNAARLCHSPSTAAMKATLGVGASTCSYRDWWGTDVLVFFGSNPANDQPVSVKYIHEAKKQGTKVVLVNPFREPGMDRYWVPSIASSALFGTDIADWWFPVAQGGDVAFLAGTIKALLAGGAFDRDFINRRTAGFAEVEAAASSQSWEALEQGSGLPRSAMEEFAGILGQARTGVFVWSMGITQHPWGADAVQSILNLGLLRGFVGRDKCGLMPIRGHSGVQGGAEMGAYATVFPGGVPVNQENARRFSELYGFAVPHEPGLPATSMIGADLDVLYSVGGNFLRALPDPDYVGQTLERVPLRVHQDIMLTDQMLLDAAEETILLPAQTRYEQEGGGTETTTERRIAFSPQLPRQVGEARTEWRILRDLAALACPERAALLGCDSGQEIRAEIARVVPVYAGIETLSKSGDSIQWGGRHLCREGTLRFRAPALPDTSRAPGTFHVSTRRGKQFNTMIHADTDPLTGAARDAVLMSEDDAAAMKLRSGDRVRLVNGHGAFEGRVHLAAIAPGNLQVHWPEGNVLLSRERYDVQSFCPDYNATVRVERL